MYKIAIGKRNQKKDVEYTDTIFYEKFEFVVRLLVNRVEQDEYVVIFDKDEKTLLAYGKRDDAIIQLVKMGTDF